jgi:hypothetical protein
MSTAKKTTLTNDKLVKNMMNYSKFGMLSPVFVMQAIDYYASKVIEDEEAILKKEKEDQANGKMGFINMTAWVGVAKEIKQKLDDNNEFK